MLHPMKTFIVTGILMISLFVRVTAQVGINTDGSQPDNSAMLDVRSDSRGFLPPRMTKDQRDAISSPVAGLMIFNSTTGTVNLYNGTYWANLDGTPADITWRCGQILTDSRDGKTYNTVSTGPQCWMAQNLNFGTRIDGALSQTDNGAIEKHCFDDLESNCDIYGGLYEWNELMQYDTTEGARGICPVGWHVPSDAAWCWMETFLDATVNCEDLGWWTGTDAGGKMKEPGTTHWLSPNTGATNASGFTAIGGGHLINGIFDRLSKRSYFWTSTAYEPDTTNAFYRALGYDFAKIARATLNKSDSFSVRCCKD
jgi:uncharacterized protein (TIGR02145 family)